MMTDTWTWATVTAVSPLRIKVDGDTSALDATTDDLVGSLAVDDRVRVHLHSDGIIVAGVQGGGAPEATAATPNTLALRDGDGQLKAADGVAADDVATVGQLPAVPYAEQAGTIDISGDGTTAADASLTFQAGLFSVAPIVICGASPDHATIAFVGSALSITATSCSIRLYRADGGVYGGSYTIPWRAVQMASGAAAGGVGG